MGRRGPPPNPLSGRTARGLNSLRGTKVIRLPVRSVGKAVMPKDLHPEAKKIWRRLAPTLEKRGHLTAIDQSAFSALCFSWAMIRELSAIIARDGYTLTGARGKVMVHPAMKEVMRWERDFLAWCKEFGLTPSSRSRIPVHAVDDDDPFEDYLDGGDNG